MGNRVLHVFMHGRPLGKFSQDASGTTSFAYEPSYTGTPLSLSLPLGKAVSSEAAEHYLHNLLPENLDTRRRLARLLDVPDDAFGLLSQMGEDVAGAAVITPDAGLLGRPVELPLQAPPDQIAYWISTLRGDPSAPPPDGLRPRFSLAGQQGKFSLSKVGDDWFWSTAELPSTHIFKPAYKGHLGLARAESACLDLARDIGIPATDSRVMDFHGQEVFVARRWDRTAGRRIHAEDLLQAYGDPWTDKYGMYVDDARRFLAGYGLERDYLRQLLFNVAIGNSDAHAKNYSLLLEGKGVALAPLYDAVPIFLYPRYSQNLCITFPGGQRQLSDGVREGDWVDWARVNGYDEGLVVEEMRYIFSAVSAQLPDRLESVGLPAHMVDSSYAYVIQVQGSLPTPTRTRMGPCEEAGAVWVRPHLRRGKPVAGHWRARRGR